MSRHRIVRAMDYNDEYDGYDDVYGHSVDDDNCISPSDASQWIYDRAKGQQSMSAFMANNENIEEEDEDEGCENGESSYNKKRRDSENFQMPVLDDLTQAKLMSCMEEIRNVVGDTTSDRQIVETVMKYDYDVAKALDNILNAPSNSVREKRTPRPAKDQLEKAGIVPKILEPKQTKPLAVTTVITAQLPERSIKKGFDISSPKTLSPAVSGRNTPEQTSPLEESTKSTGRTKDQQNRNVQQLYSKERGNEKKHLHMVVIGHVDAGKSTLMGHLLYDTGNVSQRVMHKHEQESKKLGKQSFMYAWVLDETGEERTRGITMDVGSSRIETSSKIVTLLDAPGHKDFIPNMISGATQADVALLVVDATRGEFETGFEQGGQTREHALLVRSLGVSQLGVVVNKLDTVGWSKERFDEIVTKMKSFLKQAGFKESDVVYVPCSGLTGENLVKPATEAELVSWYKGPTLLNVIDNFKLPERSIDKPFRMSVSDIFKGTGSGFCISGRIETGVLCVNDKVLVGPSREQAQIKSIMIDEASVTAAFAGDQVSVSLSGNIDIANISVGFIICDPANPIPIVTRMQARIIVFNVKVPITLGYPVLLHHQSLIEPATIVKLNAQLHKGTGEVIKKKPRCLGNNSCALVEIETSRPIGVELYADVKELGRIMLRVSGVTIAAGLITKIIK
ncbi:HBS1-like protein isoform X1 [Hermetia illucens]|uniref:HBS1-like protein isoform X1 n=1 Tax=Hermetia illucens TaxID=343691 RepID=UPI0018CC6281|nr:HBS1-like protein isoform X1 [Hermetia illucens]